MSIRNNFEITKKLIVSVSAKLRTLKSEVPDLSNFIEEFERVNFSLRHPSINTKRASYKVSAFLNSLCLNFNKHQIDGLNNRNMSNFSWSNIYDGAESRQSFTNGMFASRLLGLDGYYANDRISAGLMLILPGVIYPFHTHPVKEFYYCLSGKLRISHDIDGEKFSLCEGEISITPNGKLHSLEVLGNKPVLLFYSWLGDLNAPIRIWEKMKSEMWEGYIWRRLPGQKWKIGDLKQLSNKNFLNSFSKHP